jgi:hypothetical protein
MFLIQQITTDPAQKQTLILPDGTSLSLTIQFVPMQYGWFITSLVYQSFTLNGLRITNSPNMLHQFRNQIPFGLACFSNNNREPSQQQDFSSGASQLYILSAEEVAQYTELLQSG